MRISDWSSDVCSSDLDRTHLALGDQVAERRQRFFQRHSKIIVMGLIEVDIIGLQSSQRILDCAFYMTRRQAATPRRCFTSNRSEEHTSELQSLMRISYAVFCLKKKKEHKYNQHQ